jgi:hypothetical protein
MRDKIAAALIASGLWLMHGPKRHYTSIITRLPGGGVRMDTFPAHLTDAHSEDCTPWHDDEGNCHA